MGLSFGKQIVEFYDFGWSYSGFNAFRKRLAKEIGIELYEMDGFKGTNSWDEVKSPVKLLLNHSDCEGHLSSDDCKEIYPVLLKLIKHWPADDADKIVATKLAAAMKECANENVRLIFC